MGKGLAVTGLVLGILALIICWFGVFSFVALPIAIVALILAIVGGKKMKANSLPTGMATAALVVSIIAVVISGVAFVSCGICTIILADAANSAGSGV